MNDAFHLPLPMIYCFRLACALLASMSCCVSAQQIYKSIGPDGQVVYSDRPPTEGKVEKTINYQEQPSSALSAKAISYVEQLRRLRAAPRKEIAAPGTTVLYSASWCGYCKQAKAYLAGKGLAYQEVDVDTKEGLAAFARAGGGKGVPLLVHGDARIQGFSVVSYDAVFSTAR